jgi:alpha-beta hydrolase superfamily lysophospholipase
VNLAILKKLLLMVAICTSISTYAEPINIWFMRGLIRENAHSKFFIDQIKKEHPEVNFLGLEVRGNGKLFKDKSFTDIKDYVKDSRIQFLKVKKEHPNAKNYLAAFSLGGMIATEWLKTHPNDFNKVMLFNTSLKGYCSLPQRFLFKNIPKYLKYVFYQDKREIESVIHSMIINRSDNKKELLDHWVNIREKRPVSVANTLRQMFAASTYEPPKSIPAKNIIIAVGLGDNLVSPECSKSIAKRWETPLFTHPTGGHDITNDQPDWVISLMKKEFISSIQ